MKAVKPKSLKIEVSKTIGKVSGKLVVPTKPKAIVVLAHGAGAGMDHIFMSRLSDELALLSIGTLRFNFPFTENKKGRPDPPAVAEKTVEAVLEKAKKLYPDTPIFGSGKSFGGRMTSQRMSKEGLDFVKGIIFYGFPLHAPGADSIERGSHLKTVKVPMLFLSGTRDALANLKLITKVTDGLKLASLVTFDGADHSFKAGKKDLIPMLASITAEWIGNIKF